MNPIVDWSLLLALITALLSGFTTVGILTWWLSRQFNRIKDLVYQSGEKIIAKLEYHEQHDDSRFDSVNNELWALKLRNASADDYTKRLLVDMAELKNNYKKEE